MYLDAVRVKARHEGRVINKAVYLAVTFNGVKEVLGMRTVETEGAKFWLQVVTELKNRRIKVVCNYFITFWQKFVYTCYQTMTITAAVHLY